MLINGKPACTATAEVQVPGPGQRHAQLSLQLLMQLQSGRPAQLRVTGVRCLVWLLWGADNCSIYFSPFGHNLACTQVFSLFSMQW